VFILKIKKVLVLPDLQCRVARLGDPPGEDGKTLLALQKYVDANGPYDEGVQLGDWLDLPYFSRYDGGTWLEDALDYYEEDVAIGCGVLEPFVAVCKKFTVLEGNHDHRFKQFLKKHPHLVGKIDSPEQWAKNYLKAAWVPYWSNKQLSVKIGKAEFIHGQYCNKYHAEKHSREFLGSNVFYGHVHDIQSYSPRVRGPGGHTPAAMSLGCLCRFDQPWLNGDSVNWTQSFSEFFFFPDGNFTFFETRIFNNRFVGRDGKEYKG